MDALTTRIVIVLLGLVCCLSVGGIVILEAGGRSSPPVLGHLAVATGAAITGILVPVGRGAAPHDSNQK